MVDLWMRARLQTPIGLLGGKAAAPYPCPGGWQDQPAALMDAFAMLDLMTAGEGK